MNILSVMLVTFALLFFVWFSTRVIRKYMRLRGEMEKRRRNRVKRLPARGEAIEKGLNLVHFTSRERQLQNYRNLLDAGGLYFTPDLDKKLERYLPGLPAKEILIVKDSPRGYTQRAFKVTDLSGILQEIRDWWEDGGRGAVILDSFEKVVLENEPERIVNFLTHLKESAERDGRVVLVTVNRDVLTGKRKKIFTDRIKVSEMG